jgi:hypothetical protein
MGGMLLYEGRLFTFIHSTALNVEGFNPVQVRFFRDSLVPFILRRKTHATALERLKRC